MHYLIPIQSQMESQLVDSTVINWLTLSGSLLAPAIKICRDAPPSGDEAGRWMAKSVDALAAQIDSNICAAAQELIGDMPASLVRQAALCALSHIYFGPGLYMLSEIGSSIKPLVSRDRMRVFLIHRTLSVPLQASADRLSFGDFARLNRNVLSVRLRAPDASTWNWSDVQLEATHEKSEDAPIQIRAMIRGNMLDLKSARSPELSAVMEAQAIWI
jgi:hypothetical protein